MARRAKRRRAGGPSYEEVKAQINAREDEKRLEKLIRYSDPEKDKKTLYVWPEGVFSGYSYNEIKNFTKKIYQII